MNVRPGQPFEPSARVWNRLVTLSNGRSDELTRLFNEQKDWSRFVGVVSGTVTAGSDSMGTRTPGSGTVALYQRESGGDLEALVDAAGTAFTLTVYNWTTTATASNAWVIIEKDSLGTWWLTNEAC